MVPMQPTTHVTLATATGLVRIALMVHVGAGMVGLVTGFVALFVAKGGWIHRKSGMVFVYAMITMGVLASGIALYEGKMSTVIGGPFTAYLVFTAMTAVRPLDREPRGLATFLTAVAFALALFNITMSIVAFGRPKMEIQGVPAPMFLFLGGVALLAGIGDVRMIRAGSIKGAKRIARHLWRMCFGLFIASGSFFLGQMRFFPKPMRSPVLLGIPAIAPLLLLIYWMWRVRIKRRLPVLGRTPALVSGLLGVVIGLAQAGAQSPIPIRSLGPILATSTEDVGPAVVVRGTSDGHVIVGSGARQRVYAFDSTLLHFTVVSDSGSGTGSMAIRTTGLIPYFADSTLLPDFNAGALIVLDGSGKQVRSMALPHAQDLTYLAIPASVGRPGFDRKGRLIYRGVLFPKLRMAPTPGGNQKSPMASATADSSPILRADFDSRTVDTLAWVLTPQQMGRMSMEMKDNPAGGPPSITMRMLINPFQLSDAWAVLTDGTIAIVRVHDYHIDWVDPDGSRRSSPKMPVDWRRYTDSERTRVVDSVLKATDELIKSMQKGGAGNMGQLKVDLGVVPDSEFPTYWPPVQPGAVLSDLEQNLWILPMTSTNAANGFTYDVINREGGLFERVQLPTGYVLAGFGPRRTAYMTRTENGKTILARALLPSASQSR